MGGTPRVVVIDTVDPQMRTYLVDALKRPMAVNRATAGSGLLWGVILIVVGFIAIAMHMSNLEGGYPPGDFYSPVTFGIAGTVAYLVGALIIGHIQRSLSLRRLPQQGTFAVGTNIVVATERVHTVYSFADLEKLEVVSQQGGRGGLTLIVRIAGITWNFAFADKRSAFDVEQRIQQAILAMDHAYTGADSNTVMALDPYAYIEQAPAAPKRTTSRWIVAIPVAVAALPIMYGIDYSADESAYHQCDDYLDNYRCSRYARRGGRHDAELQVRVCDAELAKATQRYDLDRLAGMCPGNKAAIDARRRELDGGGN